MLLTSLGKIVYRFKQKRDFFVKRSRVACELLPHTGDYPMQTRSLRIRSYKSWRVNTTASPFAKARLKKLELYATLRQEGCSSVTALEALGWSRATYYRWHKRYLPAAGRSDPGVGGAGGALNAPQAPTSAAVDETARTTGVAPAPASPAVGQAQAVEGTLPRPGLHAEH